LLSVEEFRTTHVWTCCASSHPYFVLSAFRSFSTIYVTWFSYNHRFREALRFADEQVAGSVVAFVAVAPARYRQSQIRAGYKTYLLKTRRFFTANHVHALCRYNPKAKRCPCYRTATSRAALAIIILTWPITPGSSKPETKDTSTAGHNRPDTTVWTQKVNRGTNSSCGHASTSLTARTGRRR